MTGATNQRDSNPPIPAGYTYLGQFVDHDFTRMRVDLPLGAPATDPQLIQQRSPALDLDTLYGGGPAHAEDRRFYAADGLRLVMGTTQKTAAPPNTNVDMAGFDLPREGAAPDLAGQRKAAIPDLRNDENLAVAQTHLAFMRFHNRVVSQSGATTFAAARAKVVKHYQWMLKTDFLPRIVDQAIIDSVFTNGRKFFEPNPVAGSFPTMPVEFSVAAFRLGHSMIRASYEWNMAFRTGGPIGVAGTLPLLFNFSGTSGTLTPPGPTQFNRLPTNWIADFRRLYNFGEAGRPDLVVPPAAFNVTMNIDTTMVDPLALLPPGSFGPPAPVPAPPPHELNLAFRNLARANMVQLASGQQMAAKFNLPALGASDILAGKGGPGIVNLSSLTAAQKTAFTTNTPLWFYILREAELNGGRLTGVGGRIVAEVFHRSIEGSTDSIIKDAAFRPSLGPNPQTFRMTDLLLFASEGKAEILNPLGA